MNQESTAQALEHLRTLRRAELRTDPELRRQLGEARDFLEQLIGPTISRAVAARLLNVSQTALARWVDRGEIATVLTPRGRREIPLSELVELVEDVDQLDPGLGQPLARVIRERQRRSNEEIDVDRLLPRPRRRLRGHRVADLQSLAYHRLVAERLDEQLVDEARRRLRRWREQGRLHQRWAEEWEEILELPLPKIARRISADSNHARDLRQTSPFAGALTEQERKRLLRGVEERALT